MEYFFILPDVRVPVEWTSGDTPLLQVRDTVIISLACEDATDVMNFMEISGVIALMKRD